MLKCSICQSPERKKVDAAIRKGLAIREIARLSYFSRATIWRHKAHSAKNDPGTRQTDETKSLRAWRRIYRRALAAGDHVAASKAQERVDAILNRRALSELADDAENEQPRLAGNPYID